MIHKSEAIIIKSKKFSDSSKIITALSDKFGKIDLIAKAAFNPKNKFGSSIELFSYSSLTFYYKESSLSLLSESEKINLFTNISSDLDKLTIAMLIIESIDYYIEKHYINLELFQRLKQCFILLNDIEIDPFNIFILSQLYLLDSLGYALHFDNVNQYTNKESFIIKLEDMSVSNFTFSNEKLTHEFSNQVIEIIQNIQKLDFITQIDKIHKISIHDFFVKYASYHFEKKLVFKSFYLCL